MKAQSLKNKFPLKIMVFLKKKSVSISPFAANFWISCVFSQDTSFMIVN